MLFLYKILYKLIKSNLFIKGLNFFNLELFIFTTKKNFFNLVLMLKLHSFYQVSQLVDIIVIDNPKSINRFSLTYCFISINFNFRILIKLNTNELQPIVSLISLYPSSNWSEREIWDMFGIYFLYNLSLSRLLTDYGFKGYPLRKDFPLIGYFEIFYNDLVKTIVFTKVSLSQNYRGFIFNNYD